MPDPTPGSDPHPHDRSRARRPQPSKRLRRSRHGPIGGVATGIAELLDAEPALMRWIFGLSLPVTLGVSGVAYLVLWGLLPGPAAADGPRKGPNET